MFNKEKYHGEIWFPKDKENRCFCILEMKGEQVFLETNLYRHNAIYKVDKIFGIFTGLGCLTFINNRIKSSSSGITESRIYAPQYTFVSQQHFINTESLKFKRFNIVNKEIKKWVSKITHWFIGGELDKSDEIKEVIEIDEKGLKIEISTFSEYKSKRYELKLDELGQVKFFNNNEISILDAIELYKKFQKFLYFFHGKCSQFKSFQYHSLDRDEWVSVYYKDSFTRENYSNFIRLDYSKLKADLSELLVLWFANEEILFCVDVILENILSTKISHNRRFVNSFFSFEALAKRFLVIKKKLSAKNCLNEYKHYFVEISGGQILDLDEFINKIIRTRDFYVHSTKSQKSFFSEFELLYISLLLDFIVGIELLRKLKVSNDVIETVKRQAKSTYVDMQNVNKLLNENRLIN